MGKSSTLVLRFPRVGGDHVYRVARLKSEAVQNLNDKISRGTDWKQFGAFGPPMNLSQAVQEVKTRDFVVVEVHE